MREVHQRGFLHQCTDLEGLDDLMAKGPIVAYSGFDATADSLHVGHLLPIMLLRWLQKTGHKPIVLLGGATTKIGDPSGKDTTRRYLSEDEIEKNVRSIQPIFERYLHFGDGPTDAILLNNDDWLKELNYLDLLRD